VYDFLLMNCAINKFLPVNQKLYLAAHAFPVANYLLKVMVSGPLVFGHMFNFVRNSSGKVMPLARWLSEKSVKD